MSDQGEIRPPLGAVGTVPGDCVARYAAELEIPPARWSVLPC